MVGCLNDLVWRNKYLRREENKKYDLCSRNKGIDIKNIQTLGQMNESTKKNSWRKKKYIG